MKKRIIALSVVAALGGFAGSASAQVPAANHLAYSATGVGHILYTPYFSTQESNVTAISIVNTDTVNGKAVKVRFRGASNSDDVYDFQVFLSPGDVWTAGISKGADGRSQLATTDKSCTLPATVNGSFIVSRTATQAADRPAETREGYIEILNMGDIWSDGSSGASITNNQRLFTATKHVAGVAPCTSSVLSALTNENAATYLRAPTSGLTGSWSILNVSKILAYSYPMTAIEARYQEAANGRGTKSTGKLVYWDQRDTPLSSTQVANNTADPLFVNNWVQAARYDLPDLSTPYTTRGDTFPVNERPTFQALELSDAIATRQVVGEYTTIASIGGATDWVASFPTRRYFAAVRYTGTGAPAAVYNPSALNIYFNSGNTEMGSVSGAGASYQLCQKLGMSSLAFWDLEETSLNVDNIVISPGTPFSLSLCGEVAVLGINGPAAANSATFGSLTRTSVSVPYSQGWGSITTPSADGLPMIVNQFTRVNNTTTNVYYGLNFLGKTTSLGTFNF
jgi:hypothetical protein